MKEGRKPKRDKGLLIAHPNGLYEQIVDLVGKVK